MRTLSEIDNALLENKRERERLEQERLGASRAGVLHLAAQFGGDGAQGPRLAALLEFPVGPGLSPPPGWEQTSASTWRYQITVLPSQDPVASWFAALKCSLERTPIQINCDAAAERATQVSCRLRESATGVAALAALLGRSHG